MNTFDSEIKKYLDCVNVNGIYAIQISDDIQVETVQGEAGHYCYTEI